MNEPPRRRRLKRRGPAEGVVTVFVSDEQAALPIVVEKWQQLALAVLVDAGGPGPDRIENDPEDLPLLLGDVVICPLVAERNAPTHAGSFDDEVALLVVHGILHLLGMDHAEEAERLEMQSRERELLAAHYGPLAADPWA